MLEGDEYLDQLFVWHVDHLAACCTQFPTHPFTRLLMAHSLRILVLQGDGNKLAFHVKRRRQSDLIVADIVTPDAVEDVPPQVLRFYPPITEESHPPGMGYRPRRLAQYLDDECAIIRAQKVTPRGIITFMANKMGGSHVAHDRSLQDEYLQNKALIVFGEGAIYRLLEQCARSICCSLLPLRNEVALALGHKELEPSELNFVRSY